MSTVTVVCKDNEICMACESQTSFGSMKMDGSFVNDDSKIMKWGDSYVGMVGSVSLFMIMQDIISKSKKPPKFKSKKQIFDYFNKLHDKLKSKYHINPKEEDDDPVESSQYEIVIANKHGIFAVHSLREVYHLRSYWAYGSGREYALGAIHALFPRTDLSAEEVAIGGVEAGCTFDNGSSGKITSVTIDME